MIGENNKLEIMVKEILFVFVFFFMSMESVLAQGEIVMKGHNSITRPNFINQRMIYDKDSNLIEVIDYGIKEDGSIVSSHNIFNSKGEIILYTDFYGDSTYYKRNNNGDVIKTWTSRNGYIDYIMLYFYEYNSKNQLTKTFMREYDDKIEVAAKLVESNEYDNAGRLLKISYYENDTLINYEEFKYDSAGRLIENYLTSGPVKTFYKRNELNKVLYLERYLFGELWEKQTNEWNGKILIKEINSYYGGDDREGTETIDYVKE